jgi:hypothetical protein
VLPVDTALTPFDQGTSASRSTTLMGLAVQAAARDARAQLCDVAAGVLGIDAAALDVRERDVPEQLVLTEQRHVLAHELPPWIAAAMDRLHAAAERFGGVAAPPFVVYRGEVSEDSDGPVEACVPIAAAETAEVAMRREPAHREAYVRLRKAQVEYPQILSAYDGVERWVDARGLTSTDAPREVYFTADFAAAEPDDEVCDVAFPIGC